MFPRSATATEPSWMEKTYIVSLNTSQLDLRTINHCGMKLWLSRVAIYFKRVFKYIENTNRDNI